MARRPYYPVYYGDYKRSMVAICSPGARALYFELKGIASGDNVDRFGYLSMGGHNIAEPVLAKLAGMESDEFDRYFLELRSIGVPTRNGEGFIYFPDMVEQEQLRVKERNKKKRQRRRRNVPGLSPGIPLENENDIVVVNEDVVLKEKGVVGGKTEPEAMMELWNRALDGSKLPRCLALSDSRRRKCALRLSERPLQEWEAIFSRMAKTPFLNGENGRGWVASFDWITANEENALKVQEGKYDGAPKSSSAGSTYVPGKYSHLD